MRFSRVFRVLRSIAMFSLLASIAPLAQDNNSTTKKQPGTAGGNRVTVTGCLTGLEGHYTLGTMSDQLYVVHGDSALLKKFNAKMVRVTGTLSESTEGDSKRDVLRQQPQGITVTTIDKVADTCG